MSNLIARAKVVLSAAVTWIVAITVVLTEIASELEGLGPVGEQASQIIARILTWLFAAVLIIRRVRPVLDKAERGILPPGDQ